MSTNVTPGRNMPRSGPQGAVISKESAIKAVDKIIKDESCMFQLVSYEKYKNSHQGAGLTSMSYSEYYILCPVGSYRHSGWLVCPYYRNGFCSATKGIIQFNPSKGGTQRYKTHIDEHKNSTTSNTPFSRDLSAVCQRSIIAAAARAVVLDLRPLSFAEKHAGIAEFASAVFQSGQTVPPTIGVNIKSILPSQYAVTQSLHDQAQVLRTKLAEKMTSATRMLSGAASCDGVTVKLQRKHYYDFTLYYMDIKKPKTLTEEVSFCIKNVTMLLVEGPHSATAANIRDTLDVNLHKYYGFGIDTIQRNFTMVTDGAAVMASMAGSSVSRAIHPLDDKWMRCIAHAFNNVMKDAMKSCESIAHLKYLSDDFKAMKRLVQDSKQSHWNSWLPNGYHLIQEVETRFGTHLQVAERFLKSADKVYALLLSNNKTTSLQYFNKIRQVTILPGISRSYPTIEAIVDTFTILNDAIVRFESTKSPTIHKVLPNFLDIRHRFTHIINNGAIFRTNSEQAVYPSNAAKALSSLLLDELNKIEIHDLWIMACFLHPLMRDLLFIHPTATRFEYKQRAITMAKKLAGINGTSSALDSNLRSFPTTSPPQVGNKRSFSMALFADPKCNVPSDADEITQYCAMDVASLPFNRESAMKDDYFAVKFWYDRKRSYPKLYQVVLRVYSTPVSSCGSERVFSTLNKIISKDRTTLSPRVLQDIIVMRSLLNEL